MIEDRRSDRGDRRARATGDRLVDNLTAFQKEWSTVERWRVFVILARELVREGMDARALRSQIDDIETHVLAGRVAAPPNSCLPDAGAGAIAEARP